MGRVRHGFLGESARRTVALITGVTMLALVLFPAGAVAAGGPSPCAKLPVIYFATPVPTAFQAPGTYEWQYHATWTDADGTFVDGGITDPATVDVVDGAPVYRGNVLLRVFSAWGQLPDGSIDFGVASIAPTQAAIFFSGWLFNAGDTIFKSTIAQSVRWRVAGGTWSAWIAQAHGPAQSACAPGGANHAGGLFVQSWGWMG